MNDYQKRLQQISQNQEDLQLLGKLLERHQEKKTLKELKMELENQNKELESANRKHDRTEKTIKHWCSVFHELWTKRKELQRKHKETTGEWMPPLKGFENRRQLGLVLEKVKRGQYTGQYKLSIMNGEFLIHKTTLSTNVYGWDYEHRWTFRRKDLYFKSEEIDGVVIPTAEAFLDFLRTRLNPIKNTREEDRKRNHLIRNRRNRE